jgi:hypothetical protein
MPALHINLWLDFKEAFIENFTCSKQVAAVQGSLGLPVAVRGVRVMSSTSTSTPSR